MKILFEDTFINDGRINVPVGSYLVALLTALETCANALETMAEESTKQNELTEKTNSRLAWIEEALMGRTGGPRDPLASETLTNKGLVTAFNSQGEQEVANV